MQLRQHQLPKYSQVDFIEIFAVLKAFGCFEIHWDHAEPAVVEQVLEGRFAKAAFADMLMPVNPRTQFVFAIIQMNCLDAL